MEFNAETFAGVLALVGVVIIFASLMSGLIERSNFPQVAVFLALGAVLGPPGLGLLNIDLESPILRVVATLSLALVLFTDALTLNIGEVRRHGRLAFLVLGPGTLLSAALVTLAAMWLLGLPLAAAAILGAALASTDPVLLRGMLRSRGISTQTRSALRLESGLNDVVLLPIVLVAMAFLGGGAEQGAAGAGPDWPRLLLDLFLLGPGAGIAVGLLGVATLDLVRRRIGIRRDYEALYSLGIAFAAFALAESVHGSGFLAAFAAGLTISALDVELCDCFLEYGETTAEMALLFTFVLFGSSLIWTGLDLISVAALAFTLLVFAVRPLAFGLSLLREKLARRDRLLISWFGPRGLSSLLLVLLPVFAGAREGERLFAVCALVVLASVVVHGGSMMVLGSGRDLRRERANEQNGRPRPATPQSEPEEGEPQAAARQDGQARGEPLDLLPAGRRARLDDARQDLDTPEDEEDGRDRGQGERITLEEVRALQAQGKRVVLVDARTERTFDDSDQQAVGAARIDPNMMLVEQARQQGLPKDAWLAIYCA